MNFSFHFYGTYCAAREAGFDDNWAWIIAHSAQFVDDCTKELLQNHELKGHMPTCHTNAELIKMNAGPFGSRFPDEIPQVWTPFHFLPGNIGEDGKTRLKYRNGDFFDDPQTIEFFKLMCLPYSEAVGKIVDKAKAEFTSAPDRIVKNLLYIGMVMHVLADTFSHEYFVGIPSEAVNETSWITEYEDDSQMPYSRSCIRCIVKKTRPSYIYSPAFSSTSLGWLGHGRAGKYPDIPNKKYYYNPNWDPNAECFKDNPLLHLCAFYQMKNAMKFILDTANSGNFDYKKELTAEEHDSEYSSKLLKIFNSDGDTDIQNQMWAQHIFESYDQGVIEHDPDFLASDSAFMRDFMNNADEHRKMVCEYCHSISPSLKYFDI